ncbi:hypothetical protein BJ994_001119 [Arthrobacter pigmenti]|uniref:Uncharacterized protein n=1 Tax=Arthrobacter pigmenti TaxID=271432 RepID=A0A846RG05_9MICC|nr:hypothetical protein [Arthrobacter pigmenti]NJC22043.1 hypothetical protein [Arthrobacter pigmenti]
MSKISDILKKAHAAVRESGVPDPLHEVAFREAVRLIAPSSGTGRRSTTGTEGVPSSIGAAGPAEARGSAFDVSEDAMYDRVVAQTDVNRDKLQLLVHLDEEGPRIDIAGLKLGRNNADRTRAVAQILTIVRGFGLDEDATELEVIRSECVRLKVYDSANFSAQVQKLTGFVLSGTGTSRRIRARGPGIQAFPGLVDNLVNN